MIIPLIRAVLLSRLFPLLPAAPCRIVQQMLPMRRLQQIVQPAEPSGMVGFHEPGLGGEVRNQQFVDHIHQIFAGVFTCQPFVRLEPVNQGSQYLRFLRGVLVDEMEKLFGGSQRVRCNNIFSYQNYHLKAYRLTAKLLR